MKDIIKFQTSHLILGKDNKITQTATAIGLTKCELVFTGTTFSFPLNNQNYIIIVEGNSEDIKLFKKALDS
jgi:hypothetical protein